MYEPRRRSARSGEIVNHQADSSMIAQAWRIGKSCPRLADLREKRNKRVNLQRLQRRLSSTYGSRENLFDTHAFSSATYAASAFLFLVCEGLLIGLAVSLFETLFRFARASPRETNCLSVTLDRGFVSIDAVGRDIVSEGRSGKWQRIDSRDEKLYYKIVKLRTCKIVKL